MKVEICDICGFQKENVYSVRRRWKIMRLFYYTNNIPGELDFCQACFEAFKKFANGGTK